MESKVSEWSKNYRFSLCEVYEDWKNKNIKQEFKCTEDKLAYTILLKRCENLYNFLGILKVKFNTTPEDIAELHELWFKYNDLKEINFIGTDLYSNAMFIRHQVPFLYRSVGRDEDKDFDKVKPNSIGSEIFLKCLEQIKSGGKGELFSYSKCFGKMLIKYCNIEECKTETEIEIRKNSFINAVEENKNIVSLQHFIHINLDSNEENIEIPKFAVDMSNARSNKVENLKEWIDEYLGKQDYTPRYNDIFDPIGDAEVVSNFTGDNDETMCKGVKRYALNINEHCLLVYKYAEILAQRCNKDSFNTFIEKSIKTIKNKEQNKFYDLYTSIIKNNTPNTDSKKIGDILSNINWDNEKMYMNRVKEDRGKTYEEIPSFNIFKDDSSEPLSKLWKEIVFEALKGRYGYMNCEDLK